MRQTICTFLFGLVLFLLNGQENQISFNHLVNNSVLIVEGCVMEGKSFPYENLVLTEYEFDVKSVIKGSLADSEELKIVSLGGELKEKGAVSYSHTLTLTEGDKGIFFLRKSATVRGTYQVIGEKQGFFKKSNGGAIYYSRFHHFNDLIELKKSIESITGRSEKIIQNEISACLNFQIELTSLQLPKIVNSLLRLSVNASSDVPNSLLQNLYIPIQYNSSDFTDDPFDTGAIHLDVSPNLENSYSVSFTRLSSDKVIYELEKMPSMPAVLLDSEFDKMLVGEIDFNLLTSNQLPQFEILSDLVVGNSTYFTPDDNELENWNCATLLSTPFQEVVPRIDSIAPRNVAAGVGIMSENGIPGEITIYGSGFGIPPTGQITAGLVGFLDAESIGGIPNTPLGFMYPPTLDYSLWTDTEIKVKVPSRGNNTNHDWVQGVATTGVIQLIASGDTLYSSQRIYVHFGIANDFYIDSVGLIGSKRRRIAAQWNFLDVEGYTLQVFPSVLDSVPNAMQGIEAALDNWRCNSDHPIWIEADTASAGLYSTSIEMAPAGVLDSTTVMLTSVRHDHDTCQVSVSNRISIFINPIFDYTTNAVSANDSILFIPILTHEIGHGFLLRHTANIAIMYPKTGGPTEMRPDDHLAGRHSYLLGVNGPYCDPNNTPKQYRFDNIGTYDCSGTTSISHAHSDSKRYIIYPNPGHQVINIESMGNNCLEKLFLIDINGKIVRKEIISNNHQLNIQDLLPGIYFTKVFDQRGNCLGTQKFIAQ